MLSLESVRAAAASFGHARLDVFIANAGAMALGPGLTAGPGIMSVCVHPGVVRTRLVTELAFWDKMLVYVSNPAGLVSPRQGGYNTVWAATGLDVRERMAGGRVAFFEPVKRPNGGDEVCWDDELARELWDWTEEQVGIYL